MQKTAKTGKKVLSLLLAVIMIAGTVNVGLGGLFAVKASAADTKLKADANGNFKILQVADIQDSWRSNGTVNAWERTVEMIEAAVTLKKPDLIVMTGDNIGPEDSGDRLDNRNDFVYSVQRIVDCFHGVPFVVTYGNHDYERNTNGSKSITLSDQDQIYHAAGALTLKQDGMTVSSSSANSTARYGTGYLDVYDSTGTTVIERVIVLNSGNYEGSRSPAQYGRVGVDNDNYQNKDYQNVVNAVNTWTSDSSIKCIAFEHIPIQEMFYGDSATTSICTTSSSGYSIYPSSTGRINTSAKYVANTSNPTVTGDFHENAGQAYGSTLELFNALANKSNVAGLFFGHEHTNTVTGVATIGGKTLRMGYGGGMLVYSDYVGDSAYADCNPRASFYTLNSSYSGVNDTTNFKKDVLTYFGITRDANNKSLYSDNQKYISDVRLFVANTSGEQSGGTAGVGHFDEAVAKCIAAGYTPVEDTYTQNTIADGNCYATVADFNFDCYSWDGATGAKAVCLGYKTTTDPNEAITDIRIYRGAAPGATYTDQELWPAQNNSVLTCTATQNTSGTNSPVITYYNANYDGSTVRSDGQVKFNQGLDTLGTGEDHWLFYTKDYRAGLPVKSLFTNITDTYIVAGKEKPFTGTDGHAMYTNLNLNKNNNEYPYSWVQYLDGTYDLARDMAAANVKGEYTNKLRGGDKQTSCWAFIGMTHALPTDEDLLSENVVETVSPVAVPETVYLTSASGAMTDFRLAVNNKMTVSDGKTSVALQSADTAMKAYFYLPGATLNSVTLSSGTASMATKNLTFTNSNGLYSFSADLSADASYALSTGLAAGGVGTVKWTFNYTLNGESKSIDAYTTCYAPYQGAVAGIAASTSHKNGYYKYSASWTAIWGFHEVVDSQHPMYVGGVTGNADGNYSYIDSTAVYKYTLANCTTAPSNYEGGAAPNTSNLLAYDDGGKNAASKSGTTYYYKSSDSSSDEQVYVSGGTGLITYDPSRVSTIGDIPNFYFGAYFGSFGGNGDDDKLVNIERNAGFQMIDSAGNYVKTVKDYYKLPQTSGMDPGFVSATKNSDRNKANDIPLSDGARFISATYQKWINKTSVGGNGASVQANACANILFKAVDKADLRDKVAEALKLEAEGKDLDNAIKDASLVLGDPTASLSEVIQAKSVIEIELIKANQGAYIYPPAKFLAPEIIYLKPADRKTFQYFVNDCNSSYAQSIEAKSNEGTGYLVFEGPSGATITGLTCTGATINSRSAGSNLVGDGFTVSGNKVTGSITASKSSLPSAITEKTSSLLEWTVTYTINQPGRTVTQTATAYTECFAPLSLSIGTSLDDDNDSRKGTHNSALVWYTTWISGIHEIYNIDSSKTSSKEPYWYSQEKTPDSPAPAKGYYDLLSEPLLDPAAKNQARTTYFGQQNTSLLKNTNSTPNMDYYWYAYYNDGGSSDTRVNMGGNISGKIYVDTSRYAEYGQIPNLDVGTDVHTINAEINDNMAYYGYQISGAYDKNTYCIRSGFTSPATIPNQYLSWANGSSTTSSMMNGLQGQRYTAKTSSTGNKMAIKISTENKYLSAVSAIKLRGQNRGSKINLDSSIATYAEFVYTNKSALRTSYLTEISSGKQKAYYTTASWNAYENALKAVAVNLETVNVLANNDLVSTLEAARDALVLKDTAVTNSFVCTDDNSTVFDPASMTVPYCTDITASAPAAPEGYDYVGYTVNYNGGTAETHNGETDYSRKYSTYDTVNVTFKYSYKSYTLTVDPNGGTYGGSTSVTQKVNTTTALSTPTAKTGYHFDKWSVNAGSLNGSTYTFGKSDAKATALWAPNNYTVKFDDGVSGITNKPAAITATYDADLVGIDTTPSKGTEYIFAGYYTEPNGEGVKYYNADGTSTRIWSEPENKNLYSKWVYAPFNFSGTGSAQTTNKVAVGFGGKLTPGAIDGITSRTTNASVALGTPELNTGIFNKNISATVTNTINGETKDVTSSVTVYPQTNVLYEETVGTFASTNSNITWADAAAKGKTTGTSSGSTVYGYSDEYANPASHYSNGSAKTVNVDSADVAANKWPTYEFKFTGTGVDVNTTCNSNTGLITAVVYTTDDNGNKTTTKAKYTDPTSGAKKTASKAVNTFFSAGEIYQTPVIHFEGMDYATYYVVCTVAYNAAFDMDQTGTRNVSASAFAAEAAETNPDAAKVVFDEVGETVDLSAILGDDYADCEFYCVNDGEHLGALNIVPASAALVGGDGPRDTGKGNYDVCIDSIRVYNPAGIGDTLTNEAIEAQYTNDEELNPNYTLLRDKLVTTSNGEIANGQVLYIEKVNGEESGEDDLIWVKGTYVYNESDNAAAIKNYNKQGANNEVYIDKGNAIAFKVTNGAKVHVALRSPFGTTVNATVVCGGETYNFTIDSATEMYYDVGTANSDGSVSITGTNGVLAVGSVKLIGGTLDMGDASSPTVSKAADIIVALDENPAPDMDGALSVPVTFTAPNGEKTTANTEIDLNKFTFGFDGIQWNAEATLDGSEIFAEAFAGSDFAEKFDLGFTGDIKLTAEYKDGEWVCKAIGTDSVEYTVPEIDSAEFTVNFNGNDGAKAEAKVTVPVSLAYVNNEWVAYGKLTAEDIEKAFASTDLAADYSLIADNLDVSANYINGKWTANAVNVSVQKNFVPGLTAKGVINVTFNGSDGKNAKLDCAVDMSSFKLTATDNGWTAQGTVKADTFEKLFANSALGANYTLDDAADINVTAEYKNGEWVFEPVTFNATLVEETPDTPDEPDEPDTPDTPDEPDTPDTPVTPEIPQEPDGILGWFERLIRTIKNAFSNLFGKLGVVSSKTSR